MIQAIKGLQESGTFYFLRDGLQQADQMAFTSYEDDVRGRCILLAPAALLLFAHASLLSHAHSSKPAACFPSLLAPAALLLFAHASLLLLSRALEQAFSLVSLSPLSFVRSHPRTCSLI